MSHNQSDQPLGEGSSGGNGGNESGLGATVETGVERHLRVEEEYGGIHPDGCYHCGGSHPTLGCVEGQDYVGDYVS